MRLTAKVKLLANTEQTAALLATMMAINRCADWLSERAFESGTFARFRLHALAYLQARKRFGLGSQAVVRAIAKVANAYALDRRTKRTFRSTGAVAYDARILTWHDTTVSIWTIAGRLHIPFAAGVRQLKLLAREKGESKLVYRCGAFYLATTCDVAEPMLLDPLNVLGVDLGVFNIASDSDGRRYSGSTLKSVRHRHRRLRAKLQKKQTRAAKRKLHKLAGQEARFARHVNHVISKQIVSGAEGTGRAIAIERLDGIRERVRVGRGTRAVLHSWAFSQLRLFLEYKAKLAGVPLLLVDPRNSSRECSRCHNVSKANRPNQSTFRCRACGHQAHADLNAAVNLRERGRAACKPATLRAASPSDGLSRSAKLPAFSR